ncbi:MAG: hemolysin family protein [bacterium]|nr:hemolysin family protein [bacterium]
MGDDSLSGLALILALIALQAVFSLAYAALMNTRTAWLREQEESGNRRAGRVLRLTTESPLLSVTIQVATILLRFAIAGVAVHSFAEPIIAQSPMVNDTLIVGGVLLVTASIALILGDLVPEAFGSSYPHSLSMGLVDLLRALILLLSPVTTVIVALSKGISALLGSEKLVNTVTEEEIMSMVDAGHTGGSIEEEEKDMIYSVLQLDQTRASEVMVPRIDVVAIDCTKSLEEAGEIFIRSGYSRLPVYEGNIDHIEGILFAKDLLAYWQHSHASRAPKTIHDLMRPVYFVPETKRADELLKELQSQKVHMAVVVDEYGGTAGLVTIENIIEEIIGDIQDEFDPPEEKEYEEVGPDEYIVDASIDLDDFNDLIDVELPTDESDTLGGYIYTYFGRVPLEGEVIEEDELRLNVISVEGRRIRKVRVTRLHGGDTVETDAVVDEAALAGASTDAVTPDTPAVDAPYDDGSTPNENTVHANPSQHIANRAS